MDAAQSPQQTAVRQFTASRFGAIEIKETEIIKFPEGLLGFNHLHEYVLLKDPKQEPFLWLQSLEDPNLAFVVVSPFLFFPGYEINVKAHELTVIQLEDITKAEILTIITIPSDPKNLTANLRGPLVINSEMKLAKQLVLIDERYNTRHFLLKEIPPYLAAPGGRDVNKKNETADADE